ncbi:MAG TPA: GNAT family N-acetyltransferase [Acetobacteraceae bacterium]|jgi:GNAT superfamily N-acetyltransferase|nr:GNAT family N-acetyltransferase [Acetobacteraceae bacterium]
MTANSRHVIVARPDDMEPLISAMVLAFAADPVARWMYRDPQRYLAHFGRFIQAFAGKAFSTGTAWRISGNVGAALWLPPGVKTDGDAIATILDESLQRDVLADVNTMFAEMTAYHPRDPHWYLPTIGLDPHFHRKGLGSALLTEALARCDGMHMPAYLESSNPANAAVYSRLGFEALGVIHAGHSPPMVPMLRAAR